MPALAYDAAARKTIAVNTDNKNLCLILILLKSYGWGNLLATIATPSLWEISGKSRLNYIRFRKSPIVTVVPIVGT
jgi:hypothetical protein